MKLGLTCAARAYSVRLMCFQTTALFSVRALLWALCAAPLVSACGSSQAKPAAPDGEVEGTASGDAAESGADEGSGDDSTEAEEDAAKMPTKCSGSGDVCTPNKAFVRRLCAGSYPNVALHFFKKGSPWTRGYLTRKTKAWNASGGVSDNDAMLAFDEEVVLLVERKTDMGGMQVSGAMGGYDALRWDGSCVTLAAEEVTLSEPPDPKFAKVEWRYLEPSMRDALRTSEEVTEAYRTRRKECKGAFSGTVSLKCVKADENLSRVIVEHIRSGGELAAPEKLPE